MFIQCNFLVRTQKCFQKKKYEFTFCPWRHEKNYAQELLIIGPKFFLQVPPGCPNQPKIKFSYYNNDPRLICLPIYAVEFSGQEFHWSCWQFINKKRVDKTKFKTNLTIHAVCNAGWKTCLTFALSYFKYLKLQFVELSNCTWQTFNVHKLMT